MWELIVSVPDHCLSLLIFLLTTIPVIFTFLSFVRIPRTSKHFRNKLQSFKVSVGRQSISIPWRQWMGFHSFVVTFFHGRLMLLGEDVLYLAATVYLLLYDLMCKRQTETMEDYFST